MEKNILQTKKTLLALFAVLMPLVTSAHDFEVNGIYYNITSSTTVKVTYKGNSYDYYLNEYSGAVSIPATVTHNGNTYSVTSIGYSAFRDCSNLTSITIPASVTSIENVAFHSCSSLSSITIPEGVTSIGNYAFYDCSWLTSITIPDGVTSIGNYAFGGCSNLTSITIPEGVTSIGGWAFGGTAWYNNLPDGVVYIGKVLYEYKGTMPANTSIEVREGTVSISGAAFSGCSSLTAITIPEGVTSIGKYAFGGTAWYNNQPDGVVYIGKVLYEYKGTMPANTSIEVREGTVSISPDAFYYCSSLTAITIPDGVTSIGEYAFGGCSNLTSITIPEGVTSIGSGAFYNCSNLTSITIPKGVTSIGDYAFYHCSSLTAITIPEGVTSIGEYAFVDCSSLTAVHISNLEAWCNIDFGDYSANPLYYAKKLYLNGVLVTELTIPNTVTAIKNSAFRDCSSLTSITIPESVTSIGGFAFVNCTGLTSITCYAAIPPACGGNAFDGIYKQVPVYVPATSISKYWYADGWKEFTNYQPLVVVTDITLSQSTASLFVGEELVLTAEVAPDNAPNPTLAWSSSDPSVASVDITGKVVALAPGTAIVTATANDGSGVSASCEVNVRPAPAERCAAPVISYVGGKVVLTCTTEGAKVITTVTADNDNTFEVLSFDYIPTHTFTAYATKENYANSDVVTLTLCWIPCTEEHKEDEGTNEEGNGNDDTEEEEDNGILNIPSQPVLIQCTGGTITVSGLAAGTEVKVYDTAGTQQGTATATDGTATIATNLEAGSIAIVKIGDNSIKIVIK